MAIWLHCLADLTKMAEPRFVHPLNHTLTLGKHWSHLQDYLKIFSSLFFLACWDFSEEARQENKLNYPPDECFHEYSPYVYWFRMKEVLKTPQIVLRGEKKTIFHWFSVVGDEDSAGTTWVCCSESHILNHGMNEWMNECQSGANERMLVRCH